MYVFVEHIYVGTSAFGMCVQKLEVDVGCLSDLLPTVSTKAGSLIEPGTRTLS